eukprot:gene8395-9876_t
MTSVQLYNLPFVMLPPPKSQQRIFDESNNQGGDSLLFSHRLSTINTNNSNNNNYHPYSRQVTKQQQQQLQQSNKASIYSLLETLANECDSDDSVCSISSPTMSQSPPSSPFSFALSSSPSMSFQPLLSSSPFNSRSPATSPPLSPKQQLVHQLPMATQNVHSHQLYSIASDAESDDTPYYSNSAPYSVHAFRSTRQGHVTPLDCFRRIFHNIIVQMSEIISRARMAEASAAASTQYLGSRFPMTAGIIEAFIIVSLFINSHSLDRISDYWSTVQAKVFPDVALIPRILSRNKYFEIKSSLSSVLSGALLEAVQTQLHADIARAGGPCPGADALHTSRFKTPVKHRNSTKELASFNMLLEYGLANVCDLFNQSRAPGAFTPLVQVVELLTEQICPDGAVIEDGQIMPTVTPSGHTLVTTSQTAKPCFMCKHSKGDASASQATATRPLFRCSQCFLTYHKDCFLASHE